MCFKRPGIKYPRTILPKVNSKFILQKRKSCFGKGCFATESKAYEI